MRRHRLAWPNGAHFFCSVVAHSKNKIEFRRAWFGKFVPAFAAQIVCRNSGGIEPMQRFSSNRCRRMAPRAVSNEPRLAFEIQDRLGHDGARRVAGAQKQNVVVILHWRCNRTFPSIPLRVSCPTIFSVVIPSVKFSALCGCFVLVAASRPAASLRRRLHRAHKCAHEFSIH
jgi:hypothetical protein